MSSYLYTGIESDKFEVINPLIFVSSGGSGSGVGSK